MKKFTEFVPEGWVPTFHNEPPKNTEKDEVDRFLAEAVEPDLLDIIGNKLNAAVDQDKGYDKNVRYIAQRVGEMTDEEARSILKAFYTVHFDDGNLSSEYKDHITELAKGYPGMGGDPLDLETLRSLTTTIKTRLLKTTRLKCGSKPHLSSTGVPMLRCEPSLTPTTTPTNPAKPFVRTLWVSSGW